jgi:hypothetical protein
VQIGSEIKMADAIKAVRREEMGLKKKTSNLFEVPRSTLITARKQI